MYRMTDRLKISGAMVAVVLLFSGVSTALADEITLSYRDASAQAQTLPIDTDSSVADLALAAGLLGEYGVGVSHASDEGSGTCAEIATAMATVVPKFAPIIAQVLARLTPQNKDAIVAAVNAVAGVDTERVLAAVKYSDPDRIHVPPVAADFRLSTALSLIERVPSPN